MMDSPWIIPIIFVDLMIEYLSNISDLWGKSFPRPCHCSPAEHIKCSTG